eukprot:COSAG02_NODE_9732_length_2128_cov_1.580089_1_plen_162_part_00
MSAIFRLHKELEKSQDGSTGCLAMDGASQSVPHCVQRRMIGQLATVSSYSLSHTVRFRIDWEIACSDSTPHAGSRKVTVRIRVRGWRGVPVAVRRSRQVEVSPPTPLRASVLHVQQNSARRAARGRRAVRSRRGPFDSRPPPAPPRAAFGPPCTTFQFPDP